MKSRELEKIVKNINSSLAKMKISKNELAKLSGLPMSTIGRILSGERNFTVDKMIPIARALNMDLADFFVGIKTKDIKEQKENSLTKENLLSAGILSIGKKRLTCIIDSEKNIIGTSELSGDLDLAESTSNLLEDISISICTAIENSSIESYKNLSRTEIRQAEFFSKIDLKIVTQSYEFMEKRKNFIYKANQLFHTVIHMPDWQITYLTDFNESKGISLVIDKGVSLSYMHQGTLKKLGGWKFPVYDFGGENWLGAKTIHHTIEATEGLIPPSKLAAEVLSNYDGKIEKITEACFHSGARSSDVYSSFITPLIRFYFLGDENAKSIVLSGFKEIKKLIHRAEEDLKTPSKIAIHGSLSEVYKHHLDPCQLIKASDDESKVLLLSGITKEFLSEHGVKYID